MARSWFCPRSVDNAFSIERTDYVFIQEVDTFDDIPIAFLEAIVDYFKSQRLMPEEIKQLDRVLQEGKRPEGDLRQRLLLAFAEGLFDENFQPVGEDDYLGTFGEAIFKWIRESFLDGQILYCEPRYATGASTKQGIDYFEILGNKSDIDSIYFIFWEIKATDRAVTTRSNEIYTQHKSRTARLLRGFQKKLVDQYEADQEATLHRFCSYLMDYWLNNSPQKRLGGCVVHSAANQPGVVFSTFVDHFPNLAGSCCRQVCLIEIPKFGEVRAKVLELIWDKIGLNQQS